MVAKVVLMSQDSQYRIDTQDELPVVRGIVLIKNTSAFHEREQAEKHRLEQALQTADSESKAKTEFMNRMSHDFRTPINGILGMLDITGASESRTPRKPVNAWTRSRYRRTTCSTWSTTCSI